MDQALPTQFTGLDSIFKAAPVLGAMQWGDQARIAEQNNQSLQDAFRASEAEKAQLRPTTYQQKQADLRNTQLIGDTHEQTARGSRLKNNEYEQTMGGAIDATNAANKGKVTAEEITQMQRVGDVFGQAAARTATMMPMQRASAVKQMLSKYLPGPELDQLTELMAKSPEHIPALLKDVADNHYNMSRTAREEQAKYEREMAKTEQQGANSLAVAQVGAASREKVASSRSGKAAQSIQEQIASGKLNYEKAAVLFNNAAMTAELEGDTDTAQRYRTMAQDYTRKNLDARSASVDSGNQFKKEVMSGDVGTNNAPKDKPKVGSVSDLQKMYPGVPPEKLREAYKKKFGVDLK